MFNLPSGGIDVTLEVFGSYIECKLSTSQRHRECDTDNDEDWEADWMHKSQSQIINFGSEQKSWDWKERRQKNLWGMGTGIWRMVICRKGPGIWTTNQWGFDEFRCIFLQFSSNAITIMIAILNIKERTACLMIWPDGDTPGTLMDHLYQVIMNHDG